MDVSADEGEAAAEGGGEEHEVEAVGGGPGAEVDAAVRQVGVVVHGAMDALQLGLIWWWKITIMNMY